MPSGPARLPAHQNGIEVFPICAVAVLLVQFRAAPQNLINEIAVLFRIVRVACVLTYIGKPPVILTRAYLPA